MSVARTIVVTVAVLVAIVIAVVSMIEPPETHQTQSFNDQVGAFYATSGLEYLRVNVGKEAIVLGDQSACDDLPMLDFDTPVSSNVRFAFFQLLLWNRQHDAKFDVCGMEYRFSSSVIDAGGIIMLPLPE